MREISQSQYIYREVEVVDQEIVDCPAARIELEKGVSFNVVCLCFLFYDAKRPNSKITIVLYE